MPRRDTGHVSLTSRIDFCDLAHYHRSMTNQIADSIDSVVDRPYIDTTRMLPEHGWSGGPIRCGNRRITSSYVPVDTYEHVRATDGFSVSAAEELDELGVTADQFVECWTLFKSYFFVLLNEQRFKPGFEEKVLAALQDKNVTSDLRLAFCIMADTIGVGTDESVPYARKLGYREFFGYVNEGLSMSSIQGVSVNEVDDALLRSLLDGNS
jgi:hypothetical protein